MATTIIHREEQKKKIAKSGGVAVLYIPNRVREYFAVGDIVDVEVSVVGNQIRLVAEKKFYNFNADEIRNVATEYGLTVDYNKELADVVVFNATRGALSVSYTQSSREVLAPGYVAISAKLQDLSPDSYRRANDLARELKKKFDVVVRTEGDLDTINMLKEPARYKLKQKEAIELIRKSDRTLGLSFVIRFDNRKNKIDEVRDALDRLKELETKIST